MIIKDNRRYERVPFFADLEIKELSTGASSRGRTLDLSRGGIGFFAPKFLAVGSRVLLTISLRRGGQPAAARAQAVIMRASVETGGAILGAAFDQELSPANQPLLCGCLDSKSGSVA